MKIITVFLILIGAALAQSITTNPKTGEVTTSLSNGIPYSCGSTRCGYGTDLDARDAGSACWKEIKAAKKSHDFTAAHAACDNLSDDHAREYYGKRLAKIESR